MSQLWLSCCLITERNSIWREFHTLSRHKDRELFARNRSISLKKIRCNLSTLSEKTELYTATRHRWSTHSIMTTHQWKLLTLNEIINLLMNECRINALIVSTSRFICRRIFCIIAIDTYWVSNAASTSWERIASSIAKTHNYSFCRNVFNIHKLTSYW